MLSSNDVLEYLFQFSGIASLQRLLRCAHNDSVQGSTGHCEVRQRRSNLASDMVKVFFPTNLKQIRVKRRA
jgi:hypothetical protein